MHKEYIRNFERRYLIRQLEVIKSTSLNSDWNFGLEKLVLIALLRKSAFEKQNFDSFELLWAKKMFFGKLNSQNLPVLALSDFADFRFSINSFVRAQKSVDVLFLWAEIDLLVEEGGVVDVPGARHNELKRTITADLLALVDSLELRCFKWHWFAFVFFIIDPL